ncbi:MAG: hypothetical protein CL842_03345 [Crocinitomicaceae bacterium]|nr:hypothetical protein [Crocinitomicaceae bacterium]|tara:strand:- start:51846 stop:52994 length:1149 start_codon:yes stop_codon:yes gene_type:complete
MSAVSLYKQKISSALNCQEDEVFLYWKGRVALYTVLKALGVTKGDEVLLQAFTCVVVPNAIIYTGATPIYVDVKTETFNMGLEGVKTRVSDKTKVVVIQNTFGLSTEVEEIVNYCKTKEIICIEDCTHGFGGMYNEKSNGSIADFSFYSTQWNKPFSTGVGGVLRVNNRDYIESIKQVDKQAVQPSIKETLVLNALITARKYLLNDTTYWVLIKLYRRLTALNLVVGSSSPEEIEAPKLPEGFLKKSSAVQCKTGVKALVKLPEIIELRKRTAKVFDVFLKENNKCFVSSELHKNHSFLIYPILVKDREVFMKRAEDMGLPLGDWFISPIHPVKEHFEMWQLNTDDFPNANYLSKHILNIPLDKSNSEKYLFFLKENKDQLI